MLKEENYIDALAFCANWIMKEYEKCGNEYVAYDLLDERLWSMAEKADNLPAWEDEDVLNNANRILSALWIAVDSGEFDEEEEEEEEF